jgi:polysaccharide export outer membrane protein
MRSSFLLKNILAVIVGLWILQSMSSCGTTKGYILVRGPFDTAKLSQINPVQPIIRKGDILSIIVFSDNPEATKIFNQSLIASSTSAAANSISPGVSQTKGSASPAGSGYEVDADGNIIFQGIGKIKIEGLTIAALKDTLNVLLGPYLQHPYFNIRFENYKFTMMGEVAKPGIINIPGEKINILEAIALSGELTPYADRDSVFIIRETNNKREFAWMNLTKPEIMASPYFYIQQNDIIIVEPNKKKSVANDVIVSRNIALAFAVISTIAILYATFRPIR